MAGTTGFTIGGLDVRGNAYDLVSVRGWDSIAPMRGSALIVPNRHGATLFNTKRWLNPKPFGLDIFIRGVDQATGNIIHANGALGHLQDNINILTEVVMNPHGGLVDIRQTQPDTTVLQAWSLLESPMNYKDYKKGSTVRQVQMVFSIVSGSKAEYPAEQQIDTLLTGVGAGGELTITTGGNAPVSNFVMTFDTFTDDTTDLVITFPDGEVMTVGGTLVNGDSLVIDYGARTVDLNGSPYDAAVTVHRAWWAQLAGAGARLIATTATTVGTYRCTTDWNNQWL